MNGKEEEVKDLKIGDIFKKDGLKEVGKSITKKGKDVVKKTADRISTEEHLMENEDYSGSIIDAKEIAIGSRGLIIAATIIGPFAGPMAVMLSVDMDETQFKIMASVLFANAIASIITAFINDLNIRGTAKAVAKSVFYRFSNKNVELKRTNEYNEKRIEDLTKENEELRGLITEYDKLKFKVAVDEEVKKVTNKE